MKRILIVDDDLHIGNLLEETLIREGYSVSRAYSGTEALLLLTTITPDLILLDLMLPGLSGEAVLPQIKGIPVIILSAKVGLDHQIELLLDGAVDYIVKPFQLKELLARIIVQLRQPTSFTSTVLLDYEELKLDTNKQLLWCCDELVKLTRTEYAILKILMQNSSQVLTKALLLERISEDTPDCTESSLKMHISNLRKKLRDITGKDYIESVWGIGFKLR